MNVSVAAKLCSRLWIRLHTMATIQIVLDNELLAAADAAAKNEKINRSALVRRALQTHLKQLRKAALIEQERLAYLAHPQQPEEFIPWEQISVWPED